ncbi:hypothetical protein PLESTB_000183900 [Pleodorina starrii]|uniref:ARMET C-terminal domain-containing protein n=1 Tax=Pleodorina starrii TaxID=330485 RepID=A0A9W6BBR1_9CHLO|nr:hypothetical protein PLESTM_000512800 [Pleodorina starrii]GLC49114.1 hypothetical protein PLESTB_000183900 [Pleodorina starrii]GLC66091.1 hypothetical protein PLESTF_000383800 [Pleodorina starrii]
MMPCILQRRVIGSSHQWQPARTPVTRPLQSCATAAATAPVATSRRTLHHRDHSWTSFQARASEAHVAARWTGQQCTTRPNRPLRAGPALCRAQGGHNYSGASGSSSSGSIAVSQYLGRGPYAAPQPIKLQFLVGQGRSGALDCTANVFLPKATGDSPERQQQRWPLLVLSSGFLLHSGLYGSYAADLASWGLAVVLYDLPELVDDVTMVSALGSILDACTSDPRVRPHVDARALLLAGHSRGGKLSVLAAASDPRVKGIALLDPVDVTAMTPTGPGYPSALPAMRVACGPPRHLPSLVLGAACNTGVIPANANYKRFVASCPGPCWFLELRGAGHLQFLDAKVDLFTAFVQSGPTPDEAVRRVSKAALLAWALELAVPLARGDTVSGRQVTERLQQTAALLERQAPLACSLKGFDTLPGPASSGAAQTGAGAAAAAAAASGASSSASSSSSRSSSGGGGGSTAGAWGATSRAGSETQRTWTGTERGAASSASETASASSGGGGGRGAGGGRSRWRTEELMAMRARELKAILLERGVDCSDCFEKADLARRIVERC